jgi:hypothetical protein
MKFAPIGLAAMMSLGLIGVGNAAPFADESDCVAKIGALDMNKDGYVDNTERAQYTNLETNVDTDKDGKISMDERTVACKSGAVKALQGKDRKN